MIVRHGGHRILIDDLGLHAVLLRQLRQNGDALVGGLVGDAAHVGGDIGLLGQHVQPVGALGGGEGAGGAHHRARHVVHPGQHKAQKRLKQPQVAQHQPHAELHVGGHAAEHLPQGGRKTGPEGIVLFHPAHQFGKPHQGGVAARGAGVAAVVLGHQLHVGVALFHHAHHAVAPAHPGHGAFHDHAALVQQKAQVHAVLFEPCGGGGCAVAAPLLGAAGGDVHVALRLPAAGQQLFHRLHDAEQAALGVHRAAAPHRAVGNVAGEGLVGPFALGGHHVLVAHQQDGRLLAGGGAGDLVKQASVQFNDLGGAVQLGEGAPQHLVEGGELAPVRLPPEGHRLAAHKVRKALGVFLRPGHVRLGELRLHRAGGFHPRRAHRCRGDERQHQQHQGAKTPQQPHKIHNEKPPQKGAQKRAAPCDVYTYSV